MVTSDILEVGEIVGGSLGVEGEYLLLGSSPEGILGGVGALVQLVDSQGGALSSTEINLHQRGATLEGSSLDLRDTWGMDLLEASVPREGLFPDRVYLILI